MKRHINIQDADESSGKDKEAGKSSEPRAESAGEQKEPAPEEKKKPPKTELELAAERERELVDQLQRLAAEFENYKKKNAREYSRGFEDGIVAAVENIIPVLESLSLAAESASKNQDSDSVAKGVEAVRRQLLGSLETLGVAEIDPKEGDDLDLNFHEILVAQPSEKLPGGKVIGTMQKGYSMKGRSIRPARVCVSKEPDN